MLSVAQASQKVRHSGQKEQNQFPSTENNVSEL